MMLPGIDVSNWQGVIDWNQVAAGGIKFAFIKATEGGTFRDARAAVNFEDAVAAGIIPGLYHFFRANIDPAKQVENFLSVAFDVAKSAPALPPVLDLEDAGSCSNADLRHCVQQFVRKIDEVIGRAPIIYVSPNFWKAHLASYKVERNLLWVAHWRVEQPRVPEGWTTWSFWQYSNKGTVKGIAGDVDLDWFNGDEAGLRALTNTIQPADKRR